MDPLLKTQELMHLTDVLSSRWYRTQCHYLKSRLVSLQPSGKKNTSAQKQKGSFSCIHSIHSPVLTDTNTHSHRALRRSTCSSVKDLGLEEYAWVLVCDAGQEEAFSLYWPPGNHNLRGEKHLSTLHGYAPTKQHCINQNHGNERSEVSSVNTQKCVQTWVCVLKRRGLPEPKLPRQDWN